MFAVCVITLCLMSVSHQAPLACEDSVRPSDQLDRSDLEGRWVLNAVSLMDPADLESFKRRDSASSNFVNASEPSKMSFTGIFRFGDSCRYERANITLESPSFTLDPHNITATALKTSCPDCAVMRLDSRSKELKRSVSEHASTDSDGSYQGALSRSTKLKRKQGTKPLSDLRDSDS